MRRRTEFDLNKAKELSEFRKNRQYYRSLKQRILQRKAVKIREDRFGKYRERLLAGITPAAATAKHPLLPIVNSYSPTVSTDGVFNLAPFALFNIVAYEPPHVMFAPTGR